MCFFDKLTEAARRNDSLVCVGLDPMPEYFPAEFMAQPNPIYAFNCRVIDATRDLVCAYKLNTAFYEAEGLAGLDALRRTIEYIGSGTPVILDGKRADIGHSSEAYARAAFDVFGADAVTVNPYLGGESLEPFTRREDKGVFVLCHTSNPGAREIQEGHCSGEPLYIQVARRAVTWTRHDNVGLVVGATYPEALKFVRRAAPDLWILLPGIGKQGGDLEASLRNGLWPNGLGLLINASRSIYQADDPRTAAQELRDQINDARRHILAQPKSDLPASGLDAAIEDIVLDLARIGAVRFGQYTLKSGQTSPVYIDLRVLVSYPNLLSRVADAYSRLLSGLEYDRIAAIPYAAIPIGAAVSLCTGRPMIYPRKEVKMHGIHRAIEGEFKIGECAVILDDLITTGASKLEAIEPLVSAGLKVHDIVVLIDRQGGGVEDLVRAGYRVHSVITLTEMLQILVHHRRIESAQAQLVLDWLAQGPAT